MSDTDLRSLVAKLARAELCANGCPRSSVTAGGHQDAPDGGLDVRVECPSDISHPDFVPRRMTGFQVKLPKMSASDIRDEMRPKGVLRDVIRELAEASGSYVIVSSQTSVADKPLADRRQAMRDALSDVPNAAQLHTDFYDRDRLANWVNEYPGIAAWVRGKVGRPLSGWSGVANWEGGSGNALRPYLCDDKACLIDERSRESKHLTIAEGIACLRAGLRLPRQCIRLIGQSGVGKTRLVQALFEEGVGEDALDSSLAVYTDYSEETDPTARDMARELIASRQRAVLIVDNCNPATHSELARICSTEISTVSLITVEYDVRDDEPERTEVFRLQAASPELVTEWIKQAFPSISQVDRGKIGEFSDGNFRVARALCETLGKGETLGSLKDRELFERIFRQRQDPDKKLLQAAEDLALLYSIDGEDVSDEGEIAQVAAIRSIGALSLYEALGEMRNRGILQARGRFRAILPQAIANPLAAHALDRIPPAHFDHFCGTLTPRMLNSVSRRLGFLHDSIAAQEAVARWLQRDGPLGDLIAKDEEGFQVINNIAPVAPDAVLAKLGREFERSHGALPRGHTRHRWIRLIKLIGYDAHLFDSAVTLLARFLPADPDEHSNDLGIAAFRAFFHLSLSGTRATPQQRRAAIRRLAASNEISLRRGAQVALRAIIKSGHFMSMDTCDFGARSRDWGWQPTTNGDRWDWFKEAIELVIDLMPEADARKLLANELRGLWCYPPCRDAIDHVAADFVQKRPWVEGWIACRAALRYDGKKMPGDVRAKLERLVEFLKPTDLLNQARAVVLNPMPGGGGWDLADGEDNEGDASKAWKKADQMAQEVGRALADDATTRADFLIELLDEPGAQRAFECGQGLAEGAEDLRTIWLELVAAFGAVQSRSRNAAILGGFIFEAHQRDQGFTSAALSAAVNNASLLPILPYLHARIGIDAEAIERLRRAISGGGIEGSSFYSIVNRSVEKSPPEPLAALLQDIANMDGAVVTAAEILHMHFYCCRQERIEPNTLLVSVGRDILARLDFKKDSTFGDYAAHTLVEVCLVGEEGQCAAKKVCENIRVALESSHVSSHELSSTLNAMFEMQPMVALDAFLLPTVTHRDSNMFDGDLGSKSPLESLDPVILGKWASIDREARYPLLAKCLTMFSWDGDAKEDISQLFMAILEQSPDRQLFLGNLLHRLHPRSWSGSLAEILTRRKEQLLKLAEHPDEQVRASVTGVMPELDRWIENERGRDRAEEESFE